MAPRLARLLCGLCQNLSSTTLDSYGKRWTFVCSGVLNLFPRSRPGRSVDGPDGLSVTCFGRGQPASQDSIPIRRLNTCERMIAAS
eukprot:5936392-Amphidinium_carterae.5